MTVEAMGYFWVGTSRLDDWSSLAIGQLGLQAVDRGGKMRAFRMDDRKQRLIVDGGFTDGERFFGWEVANATALEALAARLEKAVDRVLAEGYRTGDIMQAGMNKVGTAGMTDAILKALDGSN